MTRWLGLLGLILSLGLMGQALTPSSFLTTVDKFRLQEVFKDAMKKDDLSSVAYGVLGYKMLGETAPDAPTACQKLQKGVEGKETSVGSAYQAAAAAKELGGCQLKLGQSASQAVSAALASEGSVGNLHYAVLTQLSLGNAVDKAAVAKNLAAALKKDDSVTNLGYAFNLAAAALDGADLKSIFDRIEDAIVQADEVDGKMLQFEGGLSVTHLVVTGAYKLSEKHGQAPPIAKTQAVKFANYFLSRKSVQQAKGACNLLQALTTLASNPFHVPVSVSLASQPTVSDASPSVSVKITDLLGKSLGKMQVVVESAMRKSDGAALLAKAAMTPVPGDDTLYEVNMMSSKPGRGFYDITVDATPAKTDNRLVGNTGAVLTVKVLSAVALDGVELGVAELDQSTAPKMQALKHPAKLGDVIEADHHHRVVLKFSVKDKANGEKMAVHQAFIRMVNKESKAEILFVAEAANSVYKFDMDVSAKAKEFGGVSGKYEVHLIVGDAVISNPFSWHLADMKLTFAPESVPQLTAKKEVGELSVNARPEIRHKFREPEKRPQPWTSNLFTALCLAPILIMFIGWLKLGINISAFPFSITAIGFHLGLGAIFGLYYMFWLQLDMFITIKYLITLGVVTFLCGNSMLSKIAENKKHQ